MGLPASSGGETARRAADPLRTRRPKPSSARPRAAQERRQFLLAPADSGRPQRQSVLPTQPDNAPVPESRWYAPHQVRREYFRRHGERLRTKPVLFATARSGLATSDRSEP